MWVTLQKLGVFSKLLLVNAYAWKQVSGNQLSPVTDELSQSVSLALLLPYLHASQDGTIPLTAMKHTSYSNQDLFSLQLCSFTQVKEASHQQIKYQTTDPWNVVPHTSHLGSNSLTGSENTLVSTTREYSQFWDSTNTIFKSWLGLISVRNRLRYLSDPSDTTGVPVLSGLWRHFEGRHYPSVGRTCCCAVHTGWCCGYIHTNISTRGLSLHIMSELLSLASVRLYACHPSIRYMSIPAVLSHMPSLHRSNHISGSISLPTKIFYNYLVPLTQELQP